MEPAVLILLLCALLGSVVGLMAGMLGIGGGLLVVPALVYMLSHFLQMDLSLIMPMAIGTSLSTIVLTGISSSKAHYRLGNIDKGLLPWILSGVAVGALLGSHFATSISGESLKSIFGALVLVIAAQMVIGANKVSKHGVTPARLGIVGLVTGSISALMGIGGGAIMVPSLLWLRQEMKKAIGSAAVGGAAIALFGTLGFIITGLGRDDLPQWSLGYLYLPATLGIVLTSVFTAGIGARLAQKLPTSKLKRIFAGFLVIVGLRMLLG